MKSKYSGTTCCAVVNYGNQITTINVGNSRAILVDKQRKVTKLTKNANSESKNLFEK